jgi:glycogen debranching enzyme
MATEPSPLTTLCRSVLRENDAGGYTVPSRTLYPFQWLWDSGFCAIGWQTFDEPRAWLELRTLVAAQWADGMIPHIVHHRADTGYPLDHRWWAAPGPRPSSGITQPPNLATAVRRMLERARDTQLAEAEARALLPALLAFHRWFHRVRDPEGSGLVRVLHPWEGGMDDSPVWDAPLERVPRLPLDRPRPDTLHVEAAQRPREATYERYAYLVDALRRRHYDGPRCVAEAEFAVAAVGVNAILGRADRDLAWLLQRFHLDGVAEVEAWTLRGDAAMQGCWSEELRGFLSRDLIAGEPIRVRTFEMFLPLFGRQATAAQADTLAAELHALGERVRYLIPSTHPDEASFEARRYWRGPVWVPVNWLLADGFRAYGHHALAARLLRDARALVENAGLREYYDAQSGEGLGGGAFSWTAALLLDAEGSP